MQQKAEGPELPSGAGTSEHESAVGGRCWTARHGSKSRNWALLERAGGLESRKRTGNVMTVGEQADLLRLGVQPGEVVGFRHQYRSGTSPPGGLSFCGVVRYPMWKERAQQLQVEEPTGVLVPSAEEVQAEVQR